MSDQVEDMETETGEDEAPKKDGRHIWIEHAEYTGGERVKRTEWIREVYQDENSQFFGKRGAIAKALTEMQGKDVPYQIAFAATKEMKDPAAAVRAAKAEAKAAAEAEAADAEDGDEEE